jgi:hypothetical protein
LKITTTSLPAATVGTPWCATLSAHDGTRPYRWTVDGLPDDIQATGAALEGTPGTAGTFTVNVEVTDGEDRSDVAVLRLKILPTPSGDLDGDGEVDQDDLAILDANLGDTGEGNEDGDLNGDGEVNTQDESILRSQIGRSSAASSHC